MSFSGDTFQNERSFDERLRSTILNLESATKLRPGQFAGLLGVSAERFHLIRCGVEKPTIFELKKLSYSLEIDIDLIFSGEIDFDTLGRRFETSPRADSPHGTCTKHWHGILEKMRRSLGKSSMDWADLLCMSLSDYASIYWHPTREIPSSNIAMLADALGVGIDSILTETIDCDALVAHHAGKNWYIPERYTTVPFSRKRTSLNILNYIETHLGDGVSQFIQRNLQVNRSALLAEEGDINIQFSIDIFNQLKILNCDDRFLNALGADSIIRTASLPAANALHSARTIPELYEMYLEEFVRSIELNCSYRYYGVSDNELIVEAILSAEVAEALKNPKFGSKSACAFKTGLISNIPAYLGMAALPVKKIRCVHEGDQTCQWLLTPRGESYPKVAIPM